MRIATYWWGGRRHVGRLAGDGKSVTPLACGERGRAVGALALIEALADGARMPAAAGVSLPLAAVKLDAPLPHPRRNIFCSGVNYRAHAAEWMASGMDGPRPSPQAPADAPEHPVIFTKVPECVIGPGEPIRLPGAISQAVDYEAELAVVIGKGGRAIPRSRAMEHVFGYTIINDVTARDVQRRHRQWMLGKSVDTFGPMGPWLVATDELDGAKTRVRCWVNGELRQDAYTRDLIFDVPALIEAISSAVTMLPGDVIATGTPAGVGIGFTPPRFLKSGDRVRIEIDGIGVLENPVQ
jgi:2-keto-4-pentenoate hydratase/2-oxohepta-3-ene-1,7-dioic acid hydratase in catechol pathway